MTRTARCACDATSITVSGEPELHGLCHCTNCKRRTGSAFGISAYFRRADVLESKGATKIFAFRHATKDHDQERHFCPDCGTTLYWYISTMPDLIGIAGGCFGEIPMPEPASSFSHGKKRDWLALPESWHTVI
jgi:hypothetical protein